MTKVLIVATSRKTRGGITSVVKAHETGKQWEKYHCKWIETHRDGNVIRKIWYFATALIRYIVLLPFYDIVHIHVGLRASVDRKLVFAKLASFFAKKIIVHFHPATECDLFDEKYSKKIALLFSYSDKLLVLSSQWIRWINQAFLDNKFNMQVLYNPCPKVDRKNVEMQFKYILYAGILSDRKGYSRLLQAFALIHDKYPDWKVLFAGNGEIEKAKSEAENLTIMNRVEFLGWISGKKKELYFNAASIYCLPSWGEGFPMGVLDAMAYGIPVVTTPVGGIPDIITDRVNGMIYDVSDIYQLASKLSVLMDSENLRKKLVVEADKLVDGLFNINNINVELGSIYEKM